MLIITIIAISLSACHKKSNTHVVVYNTSVDVPLHHWTSTDTLFYPIHVEEEPNIKSPICTHTDYQIRLSWRYELEFPLISLPATFCFQQMDTTQGQLRISRLISRHKIEPTIRDEEGLPIGDGWGSLYEHQETVKDFTLCFDQPGIYRILIIPDFRGVPEGINGMVSMGLELYE